MGTLQNFGVPVNNSRAALLQPKQKNKFRVRAVNFGPINGGLELTQQVISCSRPTLQFEEVTVHSYNSTAYYPGKGTFSPIELTVRDDITNAVSSLIGIQLNKQFAMFEQTTPLSPGDAKFTMYIEALDGGNDGILEQWLVENCWIAQSNYDSWEYSSAEVMNISLSIRFDNATLQNDLWPTTAPPMFSTTNM